MNVTKYVVARVEDIPPGTRKLFDVAGISIGIFNLGGEFFGLRNRCPHQGGPLCEGLLWGLWQSPRPGEIIYSRPGEILTCAWHGWEFDVRTGQSWCDPARLRVRSYDVQVEPGTTLVPQAPTADRVKGPYVADTFPVSAEGDYVVVELQRGAR